MAVTIETTPTLRGIAHAGSLLDELICYFPCNEGLGTTITDVHGGYTGDLTAGSASFSVDSKLGASAIESDSYSDYVIFGAANMFANVYDKISISYWVRIDTLPSVLTSLSYHVMLREAAGNRVIGIHHGTDNRLYFAAMSTIASLEIVYSSVVSNTSSYIHVCGVANGVGKLIKIYINGVDDSQASVTQLGPLYPYLLPTNYFMNNGGIRGLDGRMDEIAIWSRALTSAEVLQLYNSNLGLTYPF